MNALWPWLLIAGAGALHGLHPASGWPLASACAARGRDWRLAGKAILPIVAGHIIAVALFAAAVMFSVSLSPRLITAVAAAALLVAVVHWLTHRHSQPSHKCVPTFGLGLSAFLLAHLHGAGWLLLPALLPLCTAASTTHTVPGMDPRVATTLAVIAVHTAAMIATAAPLAIAGGLLARRAATAHYPRIT